MRLSNAENGYVFAFAGDSQSTPHFMRYSGLTGACINAASFNTFLRRAVDGVSFQERFREFSRETNWSNGEVVQRGTGGNYGEDGFLRPGFSYKSLAEYLFSKVIEYRQSGQTLDDILSADWKTKIAASLVPRGLESNEIFIRKLRWSFHHAVFETVLASMKEDGRLKTVEVEKLMRRRKRELTLPMQEAGEAGIEVFWRELLRDQDVAPNERRILYDEFCTTGKLVDDVCTKVVDAAKEARTYNARISSELSNQPKPVDSIVDDFAVEAQNFANSLTLSSAFAAGALAFRLVNESVADRASAILGGLNIAIAFSTMTNVSRYKIRNEEARIVAADEQFQNVKKAAFVLLDRETRDCFDLKENPFYTSLEEKVAAFRRVAHYYNYKEPREFNAAYSRLKERINSIEEIQSFLHLLVSKLIVSTYHVNSYVQEALVEVFRTLTDMLELLVQPVDRSQSTDAVKKLFSRLIAFEPKLQRSLQRGSIRWGFIKKRRFLHWDMVVTMRYFYSLIWIPTCSGISISPVQNDILDVLGRVKHVSRSYQNKVLRREVRDLAALYWATRESDIASIIFVSGFLTFAASVVFTVARIFDLDYLTDFAFYVTATSSLGAVLALFHFLRKAKLLAGLLIGLASKARLAPASKRGYISQIVAVTATQLLLTIVRLLAAGAAAVALPFAVAENGFGDSIQTHVDIPFWIALGSVVSAIAATVFFFFVEYVVRYNLISDLGPFVCELFRSEIEQIHDGVKIPYNDMDTKQVQDRENWEYTAREFLHRYRFDTVFAADRFGQILQYVQGGMEPTYRNRQSPEVTKSEVTQV